MCNCSLLTLLASLHVLPTPLKFVGNPEPSEVPSMCLWPVIMLSMGLLHKIFNTVCTWLDLAGFGVPCKVCNIRCAMCIDQ